MKEYDAIIIGTGQAGNPLAGTLSSNGYKTAVIEKGYVGGTCLNEGCTPTKAYVASARRAHVARSSEDLGVHIKGDVTVHLGKVKRRKDKIIAASRESIRDFLESDEMIDLYEGVGRFTGPKEVKVNEEELTADKIFINTGAQARILEGFSSVPFLTNKTILELEKLPEHLIIIGGGPVGLEFGQIFRRFGSKVTIFDRRELLMPGEDPDISEALAEVIRESGIDLRLESDCIEGSKDGEELVVSYDCKGERGSVRGSHILLAAGRIPNTSDLGLENTQIQLDDRNYIRVDDHCRTNVEGVFALGDCNGEGAFTHTSYNDYQIVDSYLFGDEQRRISDRILCYAVFIDPPFARIGMNERQIKEKGIEAWVAKRPMSRIARANEKGETQGFLKIFVDKQSEEFLGASFVGIDADEYIHTIADQMYASASYKRIRDAVHIHPTVSELLPTMLENLEPL